MMALQKRRKTKPKLRDLSRLPPTHVELKELETQFTQVRPAIVIAIIGQSLLEIELDTLLRPHFARQDDATWEKLTDDVGPLSTFYTKIVIAHAFGIYRAYPVNAYTHYM